MVDERGQRGVRLILNPEQRSKKPWLTSAPLSQTVGQGFESLHAYHVSPFKFRRLGDTLISPESPQMDRL